MDTKTNIRQSVGKVNIEGILAECQIDEAVDNMGDKILKGYLVVKTSDTNDVRLSVYVKELTKKGETNPAYTGMMTVKNQYKSMAKFGDDADAVQILAGDFAPFTGRNGQTAVGYRASFVNRVEKNSDKYRPHAEFDIETYVKNIIPEVDKEGNETGRVIVNGWFVEYSGIEPVTFVAPATDEDGNEIASAILETYHAGDTVKYFGDIVNQRIEKKIPIAIGKPRTVTSYVNELLITGATESYADNPATEDLAYSADEIAQAVQQREETIQSGGQNLRNNSKPSGRAHGGRSLGF